MTTNAHQLAYPVGTKSVRYSFGMDKANTAQFLRELADKVEKQEVALHSGGVYTQARAEDYVLTVLNLKFTEKREEEPPLKAMSA